MAKGIHYLYLKPNRKIKENPDHWLFDFCQSYLYVGLNFLWLTQLAYLEDGEEFCILFNPVEHKGGRLFSAPFDEIEDRIRFEGLEVQTKFAPDPVVCFRNIFDHVELLVEKSDTPFSVDPIIQPTMKALCKSGHARRIKEEFVWTDKFLQEKNTWV